MTAVRGTKPKKTTRFRAVPHSHSSGAISADFGKLVFRKGRDASSGVILVRVHGTTYQAELVSIVLTVLPVLERHETDWPGHFAVIERRRVRIRPLRRS